MGKSKKYTVRDLNKYLSKYYKFSLDELSGQFFYQRMDGKSQKKPWDRAYFFSMLTNRFIGVSAGSVREALKCINYQRINAVKVYFERIKPPPKLNPFEHLDSYFKLFDAPPFSFGSQLEAHLTRAVRTIFHGDPNRFIFCLISKQEYIGKTRFIEWLIPDELKPYSMSVMSGRKDKRDTILARKFVCNIDEFSGAKDSADKQLKAMLSQQSASVWTPFKNQIERLPRITTFFATANYKVGKPILSAESSNSRYILFNIKSIDWSYSANIDPVDLWAWAAARAKDIDCIAEPSIDEVRLIEGYNRKFTKRASKSRPKRARTLVTGITIGTIVTAILASPWGRAFLLSLSKALGYSF